MRILHNYSRPTPKKWRKLGDALLGMGTTLTAYSIADEWDKWISLTALLVTISGKFLTNFFAED